MHASRGLEKVSAPRSADRNSSGLHELAALRLTIGAFRALLADARVRVPEECCGFLAGHDGLGTEYLPLPNESTTPRQNFFVRDALFSIQRHLRAKNAGLIAIVHSHPEGPAVPSRADQEQNYHGKVPHMIVSLLETIPVVRAFRYGVSTGAMANPFAFEEIPFVVEQDDRDIEFHNGAWVFDQAEWDFHGF